MWLIKKNEKKIKSLKSEMKESTLLLILLKNFHHICKIQNGAADTVKLVYDDALDFAGTDILHHPFKFRSVGIFAGEAFIRVFYAGFSVGFVSAVRKLAFNGYTVFFFDGLSCI